METSTTEQAVEEISFREAILPLSLQALRQKLGQKAKQQSGFASTVSKDWWAGPMCCKPPGRQSSATTERRA